MGPALPSPALILFNTQIIGEMLRISITLFNYGNNNDLYEALNAEQDKANKNNAAFTDFVIIPVGSMVAV